MNPATLPPFDRDTVGRLVAEVIRRIQAEADAVRPGRGVAEPAAATLGDRVITLHVLERLPAGTRRVVVAAKAVITPSARDHAKEVGIAIVRAGPGTPASDASPSPFLVARARCPNDPSAQADAIARAVPGGRQLPPAGLADVIAALATHASRDGARGILLTSRPALAVILANRSASLRAVTGRDAPTIAAMAADCEANLVVVDPVTCPGGLERLCVAFAARAAGSLPVELTTAPAGCGCTTPSH